MASPEYLERTGRPKGITDLNGHALLRFSGISLGDSLSLEGPDGRHRVAFRTVMLSENETILQLAALRGMGLVFLPQWMVEPDIEAGRLEIVLLEALDFTNTLHAVYPSRKYLSAKVRTFIDLMTARLEEMP